jgi:hypothetical protein
MSSPSVFTAGPHVVKASQVTDSHPIYGEVRQVAWETSCSRCGKATDEVPLILFAEHSDRAWMFCDDCATWLFEQGHIRLEAT